MRVDLYTCDKRARIKYFKSSSSDELEKEMQVHLGLACVLISDLLSVDGYSEMTIAFGLGISLDKVLHMAKTQLNQLTLRETLNLLRLYLSVFDKDGHVKK